VKIAPYNPAEKPDPHTVYVPREVFDALLERDAETALCKLALEWQRELLRAEHYARLLGRR